MDVCGLERVFTYREVLIIFLREKKLGERRTLKNYLAFYTDKILNIPGNGEKESKFRRV